MSSKDKHADGNGAEPGKAAGGRAAAAYRPGGVVWRIFTLAGLAFVLPVQVHSLPYPELFTQAGIVLTFLAIVAAFVR